MVLVCYRAQTYVQLWMNSTTCFALHFQEARLLDASRAGKIEHDTQEFHLHCCSPPRGIQEHFHYQGNFTLQSGAKVQIVSLSLPLFIRHYYRNPFQFVFLRLLICLNSAGLWTPHHIQYKLYYWSKAAQTLCCPRCHAEPAVVLTCMCTQAYHQHYQALVVSRHPQMHFSKQWWGPAYKNFRKQSAHSETNWFTEFCKLPCISQLTASFINAWAKAFVAARGYSRYVTTPSAQTRTAAAHAMQGHCVVHAAPMLAGTPCAREVLATDMHHSQLMCPCKWSFRRFTYGNLVTTSPSSKW